MCVQDCGLQFTRVQKCWTEGRGGKSREEEMSSTPSVSKANEDLRDCDLCEASTSHFMWFWFSSYRRSWTLGFGLVNFCPML